MVRSLSFRGFGVESVRISDSPMKRQKAREVKGKLRGDQGVSNRLRNDEITILALRFS
jgi:hypothetical protein